MPASAVCLQAGAEASTGRHVTLEGCRIAPSSAAYPASQKLSCMVLWRSLERMSCLGSGSELVEAALQECATAHSARTRVGVEIVAELH